MGMAGAEEEEEILTTVRFEGIDDWGRPVFKDVLSSQRYGSVDVLCYGAGPEDVARKVSASDLTYFGDEFNCEPYGSDVPGGISILK